MAFRRDVERLQAENKRLREDVERLTECLKTTTEEKQDLSLSLEREIERLRCEVERQLRENSSLKLQLVRTPSKSSLDKR